MARLVESKGAEHTLTDWWLPRPGSVLLTSANHNPSQPVAITALVRGFEAPSSRSCSREHNSAVFRIW